MRWFLTHGARLLCAASLAFMLSSPAAAQTVDSVNADKNPLNSPVGGAWTCGEVGWQYTPSFSYSLTGVETRFGITAPSQLSRTVTLEIWSAPPSLGGALLRSAGFTPLSDAFSGASFAALDLVGGQAYFIGFRSVTGLGANVTLDPGAVALPPGTFYGPATIGQYPNVTNGSLNAPILKFNGTRTTGAVVPEPVSLALFLPGVAVLGLLRRRRRGAEA